MFKNYKKITLLASFLLSLFVSNVLAESEYLIGYLTKQQSKNFAVGLGIGATHGAVNQSIGVACQANDLDFPLLALLATYIAANKFESVCNGGNPKSAMLWGRGIGQILIESIHFALNEQQKRQFKFNFIMNLSIFKALLS